MTTAATASRARLVLVTAANEEQGVAIGRTLVDERLAACVNLLGPMRSIYRWRDAVEDGREYLLLIKTRAALVKALERRIRELHTYEVPEVIALKLDSGSPPYLAWLAESTRGAAQPARRR